MSKLNEKALHARKARELALQLLYQQYTRPDDDFNEIFDGFALNFAAAEPDLETARQLAFGIYERKDDIDEVLIEKLVGWRPERICHVDKAAISIALYEIYYSDGSVPMAVAIDEAVELAKLYGTDDSGRFVNGVLGNNVREKLRK